MLPPTPHMVLNKTRLSCPVCLVHLRRNIGHFPSDSDKKKKKKVTKKEKEDVIESLVTSPSLCAITAPYC